MMKSCWTILITLAIHSHLYAQKSSVKFHVGYGIGIENLKLPQVGMSSNLEYHSSLVGSYGRGLQFEIGYAYSFNRHCSLQLDVGLLKSDNIVSIGTYAFTYTKTVSFNSSTQSQFYSLAPLFKIEFQTDGKWKPFGAIGPIFATGTVFSEFLYDGWRYNQDKTGTVKTTYDIKRAFVGSVAVGFKSLMGMQYALEHFSIFTQITFINLNFVPERTEWITYQFDGIDMLNSTNVANYDLEGFNLPLGSLSLNIGVAIKL